MDLKTSENSIITCRKAFRPRYLICFLMLFLLCRLFPYTGDDWTWGGPIGIERLHAHFEDYGGRYLGYLIVLALARSVWLRAAAMAAIYTGTFFLIERIVGQSLAYYVSILCFLAMPKFVLRQAVVWTSGFSNYGFATFFSLLFAWIVLLRFRKPERRKHGTVLSVFFLFLLGLCNSLILENMTIYMVILSVTVVILYHRAHKTWDGTFAAHAAGVLAGAALMFSNSAYRNIFGSGDTYSYRQFSMDSLSQRIIENWHIIYQEGFLNNLALNVLLLFSCFSAVFLVIMRNPRPTKRLFIPLSVFAAFVAWSFFSLLSVTDLRSGRLTAMEGFFTLAAALCLFSLLLALSRKASDSPEGRSPETSRYFILSFFMILGPLLPVSPIGSRCFYNSYIYLTVLLCELICQMYLFLRTQNILSRQAEQCILTLVRTCTISCIGILYAVYLVLFSSIHRTDVERLRQIRERAAKGETQAEILHFPHESFLWNATPPQGTKWEYRYKLYYGIPDEISLIPIGD